MYCGWLLFEFIFIFRYIIETKGRSLEQTAALFDGEDHADALGQGTYFFILPVLTKLRSSLAGYDAARHTQIRTRDYEHYDYFSVYIDREDDKVYELRQVDHSEQPTSTRAQRQRARKTRQPSENSIHADYSGYRY